MTRRREAEQASDYNRNNCERDHILHECPLWPISGADCHPPHCPYSYEGFAAVMPITIKQKRSTPMP
jgi:hypothetical protein